MSELGLDISNTIRNLLEVLAQFAVDLANALVTVFFAVGPMRTQGPWPFGRPVAPQVLGANAGLNGGMVPAYAARAYDYISPTNQLRQNLSIKTGQQGGGKYD